MNQAPPVPTNRLIRQIGIYARVQWVFAGAMMATAMLFYFAVYRQQAQQLDGLNRQISAKRAELEADKNKTSKLPRVQSELDILQANLAGFKKLPMKIQYGEFIGEIDKAADRLHIDTVHDDISNKPTLQKLYYERPVILSFETSFANAYAFLKEIENMDRLTRLRDVEIKTTDPVRGTVSVKLSVNIYYTAG